MKPLPDGLAVGLIQNLKLNLWTKKMFWTNWILKKKQNCKKTTYFFEEKNCEIDYTQLNEMKKIVKSICKMIFLKKCSYFFPVKSISRI